MSSLHTVDCPIKDIDAAARTSHALGGELVRQSQFQWHGHKSPCDYAIKVPGTSWEIGLIKDKDSDHYNLKFDTWSQQGEVLSKFLGGKAGLKFTNEYKLQAATAIARRKGFTVQRVHGNGKTQLILTGV
jgi:hypothetical protein